MGCQEMTVFKGIKLQIMTGQTLKQPLKRELIEALTDGRSAEASTRALRSMTAPVSEPIFQLQSAETVIAAVGA